MSATFQQYELKEKRAKPEVRTLYMVHRRTYNIPFGSETLLPAKGAAVALADVTGTGIMQPRVQNISRQKSGAGWLCTIVFVQITQTSASGTLDMEGRNYWRGMQQKLTFKDYAPGEAEQFYGSEFPGFSGDNAPIVKRVHIEYYPWGVDTLALLHLMYETKRQPGKARLTTETNDREVEIRNEPPDGDTPGLVIEGPDSGVGWSGYWKVVEGNNKVGEGETNFVLQTAYYASQFNLAGAYAIWRHVNAEPLAIVGFGTAPAGTVRIKKLRTSRVYGDDIMDLDYVFGYEPAGWNNMVKSQIGMWGVEVTPTLDANGALMDEADWHKTVAWNRGQLVVNGELVTAGAAVEPQSRRLFTPINMSQYLAGLTDW